MPVGCGAQLAICSPHFFSVIFLSPGHCFLPEPALSLRRHGRANSLRWQPHLPGGWRHVPLLPGAAQCISHHLLFTCGFAIYYGPLNRWPGHHFQLGSGSATLVLFVFVLIIFSYCLCRNPCFSIKAGPPSWPALVRLRSTDLMEPNQSESGAQPAKTAWPPTERWPNECFCGVARDGRSE